jgi:uncharacterized protein (TIGR03437 family)
VEILSADPAAPLISSVQDAESAQTSVVPGQWVAIYGANLAKDSRPWNGADFTSSANLPTSLGGVKVTFNKIPAAVYYISPGQVDAQVPGGLAGPVDVMVTNQNADVSASFTANIVANAPSLYYYSAGAKLYAVATHADNTLIGDPAVVGTAGTKVLPGETIVIYVNGLAASPAGTILGAIRYPNPVTVAFTPTGGSASTATADYAGVAFAGGFQVNVKIPSSLKPGDYSLTVATQGQTSPTGITLSVGP